MRILLPLCLVVSIAAADRPATAPGAPKKDLRSLMAERGDLLFRDSFIPGEWEKRWGKSGGAWQAGEWKAEDEAVRCRELPEEKHHTTLMTKVDVGDVIIQFSFKFEDCDQVFVGFDAKEHIARVFITKDKLRLTKTTGIGPTTKSENIDEVPVKLEPGTWHTVLLEIVGTEMIADIDETWFAYGSMDGIEIPKTSCSLMTSGKTGVAWFDEVAVWKPVKYADWEAKRRPRVLQKLKRKQP